MDTKNTYSTSSYDSNKIRQEGFEDGRASIQPIDFKTKLPEENQYIIVIGEKRGASSICFDSDYYFSNDGYYSQRVTNEFIIFGTHWIPFPNLTK